MRDRRSFAAVLFLVSAAQDPVRLNAPLPSPTSGVLDFELDASGTHAVYVADQERAGVHELYRVPLDLGAAPVRLHAPLPSNGDVLVAVRPNLGLGAGGRVVYRADAAQDEAFELYSVPLDGSQPEVRLSGRLTSGGDVHDFALTPDGSQVLYVADQDADEVRELYAVPIDGSAPARKLHEPFSHWLLPTQPGPTLPRNYVERFWISPDGEQAVYSVQRQEVTSAGRFRLYRVPIDGGAPPALLASADHPSFSSWTVRELAFSPDGQWLAYVQEFTFTPVTHTSTLYLQRADGSGTRLPLATGGGCCGGGVSRGVFIPDSERVVWSSFSGFDGSGPAHHLFSSDPSGVVTPLDEPLADVVSALAVASVGDSVFALFANSGAYRMSSDGSGAPLLLGATSQPQMVQITPDQSRIVFGRSGLNSLSTSGGDPLELSPPIINSILSFRILPDSRGVVHEARVGSSRHELRIAASDGSFPTRTLHPPLPVGGTVAVEFNVDRPLFRLVGSRAVAFRASLASATSMELWLTPLVRSGPVRSTPAVPATAPAVSVP